MDEWFEPMRFVIDVIEVKSACRVQHQVGEVFHAEYRTPTPAVCGEAYIGMYPLLYAMRIDGDMRQLGKKEKFETTYYCPGRVVKFRIKGIPLCNKCGKEVESFGVLTKFMLEYPIYVCKHCLENLENLNQ